MKLTRALAFFMLMIGTVAFVFGAVTPAKAAEFDKEWKALLKAAQKEGKIVTFICCGAGRGVGKMIPEFEKKFGIKWINSSGSSSQQAGRVLAERRAGRFSLDVWMGGARTSQSAYSPEASAHSS
jgi:hypothetical protein